MYIRYLLRFFDCLAHPNLSATFATDEKWPLCHLRISYQSLAGSLSSLQKSRSKYSSPCLTPQSLSIATLVRDAQWQIKSCNYPFNQVFLWKATSLANECQINVKLNPYVNEILGTKVQLKWSNYLFSFWPNSCPTFLVVFWQGKS